MNTRTRIILMRIPIILPLRPRHARRPPLVPRHRIIRRLVQPLDTSPPHVEPLRIRLVLVAADTHGALPGGGLADARGVGELRVVGVLRVAAADVDGAGVGAVEVGGRGRCVGQGEVGLGVGDFVGFGFLGGVWSD